MGPSSRISRTRRQRRVPPARPKGDNRMAGGVGSNRAWQPQALARAGWIVAALLAGCTPSGTERLTLAPVAFQDLPGWQADRVAEALPALLRSCGRVSALPAGQSPDSAPADWAGVCDAARAVPAGDEAAARSFVEQRFRPYAVGNDGQTAGLLTGYYEPQLEGAQVADARMQTPLLARPADLVEADLGAFAADLAGKRIAGRVQDGRLVPYWDRAQIEAGALRDQDLAILYVASPVDAFFLQIQGSGRVVLSDGQVVRVGYAGQNGRPYVAIGKVLADRGQLKRAEVTMQSIRDWLAQHPAEAAGVMAENPSYVFFRELPALRADEGPLGALGVPLTPGRSIAVDRRHIPLGLPVWVDTTDPLDGAPLRRLMLAQDVGGAIKGPVRADLFFGWGAEAEARAGRMRQPGRLFVLLPRPAAP